jgi:hypothetical protein
MGLDLAKKRIYPIARSFKAATIESIVLLETGYASTFFDY